MAGTVNMEGARRMAMARFVIDQLRMNQSMTPAHISYGNAMSERDILLTCLLRKVRLALSTQGWAYVACQNPIRSTSGRKELIHTQHQTNNSCEASPNG